jgi:hypothetical protein
MGDIRRFWQVRLDALERALDAAGSESAAQIASEKRRAPR